MNNELKSLLTTILVLLYTIVLSLFLILIAVKGSWAMVALNFVVLTAGSFLIIMTMNKVWSDETQGKEG